MSECGDEIFRVGDNVREVRVGVCGGVLLLLGEVELVSRFNDFSELGQVCGRQWFDYMGDVAYTQQCED